MNWIKIICYSCVVLFGFGFSGGVCWAKPYESVVPEVFGIKLGADIRDYPGMKVRDKYDDGTVNYIHPKDAGRVFGKVETLDVAYATYKSKICAIIFTFKPDKLGRVLDQISSKYGKYELTDSGVYGWWEPYFSILVEPHNKVYIVYFRYDPLMDKLHSDIFDVHSLSYNDIFLNEPINKYKFMIPYISIEPNYRFAPGVMFYYSPFNNGEFGKDVIVIYHTYEGIISAITIYFRNDKLKTILDIIHKRYANLEEKVLRRHDNIWMWDLGEYAIRINYIHDEANSIIEFGYWPLLVQEKIAAEKYFEQ